MNTRLRTGKGVSGAVRYVMGEGRDPESGELKALALGAESRVAWVSGTGFGFEITGAADVELARRMMEYDASPAGQGAKTKLCQEDCVHIMLGWSRGETPSRTDMETAAKTALKSLGMEGARAVFVSHRDEDYEHVHIVASRLNPATGLTYDLEGSQRALSRFAEKWERDHGGVINLRRADANQLRDAIADRDAGAVLDAMVKQRATFTPKQLENALGKEIKNELGRAAFASEIMSHARTVALSDVPGGPATRYSTQEAIEAERYAFAATERLAAHSSFLIESKTIHTVLDQAKYAKITTEQRKAFYHATGKEGLSLIDGQAGTGKTDYTITAAREAYEAQGYRVIGLGPSNKVAIGLGDKGFARSETAHQELIDLNTGRQKWDAKTVIILDEAAMVDTKIMAQLTTRAAEAGAKMIMVGDDRQLTSIDRGGMFGVFKDRYGAAEITEVKRQNKQDERRASEQMAKGDFDTALRTYEAKGSLHWTRTQPEARKALIDQWAKDSAAAPTKTRMIYAYTNEDVDLLAAGIRQVRRDRGELGVDHMFETKHGRFAFADNERIQFSGANKDIGITNGATGTIETIKGTDITVKLDGKTPTSITFDATTFNAFRQGDVGTIWKSQSATVDQTYLYHSEHWRSAGTYVALTRHRDKTEIFAATNTLNHGEAAEPWMLQKGGLSELGPAHTASAKQSYATWAEAKPELAARYGFESYVHYVQEKWAEDTNRQPSNDRIRELARQMARTDDRRAASAFHTLEPRGPLRPRTADELAVYLAPTGDQRGGAQDVERQQRERDQPPKRGKVAGEIRLAWSQTRSAEDFSDALAAHGMSVARVGPIEAINYRQAAFMKAVTGKEQRTLAEGELVVVNQWGSIYQLDQRLTGSTKSQIAEQLAGFEGAGVMNVSDTSSALREASRAAWLDQKLKERPATPIEQTIFEALKSDFATGLDVAGITIARATDSDRIAIKDMRQVDDLARLTNNPTSGLTLPKAVSPGDLFAVTPRGHVFALNPNHVNFVEVAARLDDKNTRLPSITDARALNEKKMIAAGLDKRIIIARATEADSVTIGAMRQADNLKQLTDKPTSGLTLPDKIAAGNLFAVTTQGVFALNAEQVKFVESRQGRGAKEKNLPSITDARAAIAEQLARPDPRRADALAKRISRQRRHAFKESVRTVGRNTRKALSGASSAVPNRSANLLTGVGRVIASAFEVVANMFAPPPPLSRDQRERQYRSNLLLAERIEAQQKIDADLELVHRIQSRSPIYDRFPGLTREAGGERIAERDAGGLERERKQDPSSQ